MAGGDGDGTYPLAMMMGRGLEAKTIFELLGERGDPELQPGQCGRCSGTSGRGGAVYPALKASRLNPIEAFRVE